MVIQSSKGNDNPYRISGVPSISDIVDKLSPTDSSEDAAIAAFFADGVDYPYDAGSFRDAYLRLQILSKYNDGSPELLKERTDRAFQGFVEGERLCKMTNRLFSSKWPCHTTDVSIHSYISVAAKKISDLLGPFDMESFIAGVDFGPGASTRLGRAKADLLYKFQGNPEATHSCAPYYEAARKYFGPSFFDGFGDVNYRSTNKLVTVPKNSKTERVIAIEPDLNMFFQKGIGSMIRRKLKHVGIDLDDQTLNQRLARVASITEDLATIDLKSASDSVSLEIVRALLPPDWYEHLFNLRSPAGVLPDGSIVNYQKFSSMGNGYTFELESLIFWALASAVISLADCKRRELGVYGDDLIVPSEVAPELIILLDICGFSTNLDKTFIRGPFKESCGKHFFKGVDVTPFYIRRPINRLHELFLLHNNFMRWSANRKFSYCEKAKVDWLRSFAPVGWQRPRIPLWDAGDGAFCGNFDECLPSRGGAQSEW